MAEGRKVMKFGDITIPVVDPDNVLPVSADVFTELWAMNGVVHLSLASLIKDGDDSAEARIVSRVRFNLTTLLDLQNAFAEILGREMPGKERAN